MEDSKNRTNDWCIEYRDESGASYVDSVKDMTRKEAKGHIISQGVSEENIIRISLGR